MHAWSQIALTYATTLQEYTKAYNKKVRNCQTIQKLRILPASRLLENNLRKLPYTFCKGLTFLFIDLTYTYENCRVLFLHKILGHKLCNGKEPLLANYLQKIKKTEILLSFRLA